MFQKIAHLQTDFNGIPVTKYRSQETGLTVAVVDVEGPLVNGYFALATEALDDDGCPHTLEHLVFLGSEDYPYKGVLDSLANRALARGTNAWTDVDHTCYTITTAGSEGFLNLLPIYLDHVLYPTISASGYHTEVHHINGKGEDAGVVYCEMQGRENTESDLVNLQLRRRLYPTSGYRSETGGLMKNLRALSVEKIRQYHRDYYRPDNLCLIITGQVDHAALLKSLDSFDVKIQKKGKLPSKPRPWVDSPPLGTFSEESLMDTVEFPDEEEATGSVTFGWRGTKFSDFLEESAMNVLSEYLTQSAVALLTKEFVEVEDSYATDVDFHFLSYLEGATFLAFEGVPTEKLNLVKGRFFEALTRHADQDGIDMERMQLILERIRLQTLSTVESHASDFFAHILIAEFMYGAKDGSNLKDVFAFLQHLKVLKTWTANQWSALIHKYLLDRPHVCVIGKPSAALAEKLEHDEETRVAEQREKLGEAKLKELEEAMKKAHAENEQPIPSTVFTSFPVPSANAISFIPVQTAQNPSNGQVKNGLVQYLQKDSAPAVPYFIQFDQVNSSFVSIALLMDTVALEPELRDFLEVYLEMFFTLPMLRNGVRVEHEDVVKQLDRDTLTQSNSVGVDSSSNFSAGTFSQLVKFQFKIEKSKYAIALDWLRDLLWNSIFTPERVKIAINKLLNDVPNHKREGMKMCTEMLKAQVYDPVKSNHTAVNVVRQQKFLTALLEKCDVDFGNVQNSLELLRQQVCSLQYLRVHITGNISELERPLSLWSTFALTKMFTPLPDPIQYSKDLVTPLGSSLAKMVYVVSMPAIESSYCVFMTKGPGSFDHPDIAPLMVLNEYLSTMEGPFWKQVRGNGLAYGASLRLAIESAFISFVVYRSPDAFKAFAKVKEIIGQFASGKEKLDEKFLEAAKSSVVFSVIAREETMAAAASESFLNQVLRGVGPKGNRDLLAKISAVKMQDLETMLQKYLVRLFEPASSIGCVTSTPSKVQEISSGFTGLEYTVQEMTLE